MFVHYGQQFEWAPIHRDSTGTAGFDTAAYIQTDPPGGSTEPGRSLLSTIALR